MKLAEFTEHMLRARLVKITGPLTKDDFNVIRFLEGETQLWYVNLSYLDNYPPYNNYFISKDSRWITERYLTCIWKNRETNIDIDTGHFFLNYWHMWAFIERSKNDQ